MIFIIFCHTEMITCKILMVPIFPINRWSIKSVFKKSIFFDFSKFDSCTTPRSKNPWGSGRGNVQAIQWPPVPQSLFHRLTSLVLICYGLQFGCIRFKTKCKHTSTSSHSIFTIFILIMVLPEHFSAVHQHWIQHFQKCEKTFGAHCI